MYEQSFKNSSTSFFDSSVGVLKKGFNRSLNSSLVSLVRAYPIIFVDLDKKPSLYNPNSAGKVFFLAKSPDAPKTTMTVSSLNSIGDDMISNYLFATRQFYIFFIRKATGL
ncbi:hypothetical protein OGAPHI_001532 [Ogataea philodendri]|uniref:Uncharacterized protein n=1 Tax=Ogataea philodendri TaxID=1378263 RepID=A0A9P8T8W5_9ASCO|nr:uncharacterized protein OGAPHI_001532 [Ogataea philodendri]KAH3669411.1 hypothetical protein OGAPHI_001532 [Ogataea philodendri]